MTTPLSDERLPARAIAQFRHWVALSDSTEDADERRRLDAMLAASVPDRLDEVERLRALVRDHLYGLRTEVARLRARNAELVAVLRSVEWEGRDADDDGKPIETCPACRWWKTQGHHPQCDLDAALRDKEITNDNATE